MWKCLKHSWDSFRVKLYNNFLEWTTGHFYTPDTQDHYREYQRYIVSLGVLKTNFKQYSWFHNYNYKFNTTGKANTISRLLLIWTIKRLYTHWFCHLRFPTFVINVYFAEVGRSASILNSIISIPMLGLILNDTGVKRSTLKLFFFPACTDCSTCRFISLLSV